jgi:hypothetical protein
MLLTGAERNEAYSAYRCMRLIKVNEKVDTLVGGGKLTS